jgi:hypothetical protein
VHQVGFHYKDYLDGRSAKQNLQNFSADPLVAGTESRSRHVERAAVILVAISNDGSYQGADESVAGVVAHVKHRKPQTHSSVYELYGFNPLAPEFSFKF